MKIIILYFSGCPSWETGLKNLRTALQMEQLEDSVEVVKIRNDSEATQLKFLGSPSFQVDGQDLWPEEREIYSLSCRVYKTSEGLRGWPSVEMLREKLQIVRGEIK